MAIPMLWPFSSDFAGFADLHEFEVGAVKDCFDVVQVNAAVGEAPRNYGLIDGAGKRADQAEIIGIAHVQLERLFGVAGNPEIGVDLFGIDARAQVLLDGVGRRGLHNRFDDGEFRLAVFEFGVQALADGLRERAGIVHDYQTHALRGLVVHQINN